MAGSRKSSGNGANLGFEEKLWAAADKLRGHMDAGEYKHVVLGLIFLKYISDAFQELFDRLKADKSADREDRDEYTAENVFWVPKAARWPKLQAAAKQPTIGSNVNDVVLGEGGYVERRISRVVDFRFSQSIEPDSRHRRRPNIIDPPLTGSFVRKRRAGRRRRGPPILLPTAGR